MDTRFKPKPGDAGSHPTLLHVPVGELTENDTTVIHFPPVGRKVWIRGATISSTAVPADADGTIVATLKKRRAADDTEVAISAPLDLEGIVASEGNPFKVSGIGESARIIQAADTIKLEIVSDSAAIDTQPANAFVTLDLLVLQ